MWVDTHCHLDVWPLSEARPIAAQARAQGVVHCVIPSVEPANFNTVREMAHALGYSYALGIHPLYVQQAGDKALEQLEATLQQHQHDARLVAVGEIGLDFFVPALQQEPLLSLQKEMYRAQIRLAKQFQLPVILHVRKSVDMVLKFLREAQFVQGGIAHAFNGSLQQAQQFLDMGFKLGSGGAVTFARALHLQDLARRLPLDAIVLETDSPDIPPTWLYVAAEQRQAGAVQTPNTPAQLARIAAVITHLRHEDLAGFAEQVLRNTHAALPRLQAQATVS